LLLPLPSSAVFRGRWMLVATTVVRGVPWALDAWSYYRRSWRSVGVGRLLLPLPSSAVRRGPRRPALPPPSPGSPFCAETLWHERGRIGYKISPCLTGRNGGLQQVGDREGSQHFVTSICAIVGVRLRPPLRLHTKDSSCTTRITTRSSVTTRASMTFVGCIPSTV
jgi:hypothetical protein